MMMMMMMMIVFRFVSSIKLEPVLAADWFVSSFANEQGCCIEIHVGFIIVVYYATGAA